ncbi:MAG: YbhB/YbcL family Raf kinase inhibitor-like protein [Thermoguttaceae bacterium]
MVLYSSCKRPNDQTTQSPSSAGPTGETDMTVHTMKLSSSAFETGTRIPEKYTADGLDLSPPIVWKDLPEQTKELVLICDDPDAPTVEPWVHWVIYKISPDLSGLPEGLPQDPELGAPVKALQGKNSWITGRIIGYRGPAPPKGHGVHRYHFTLYSLDTPLEIGPGVDRETILEAMHGKVIEKAEIIGLYQRD